MNDLSRDRRWRAEFRRGPRKHVEQCGVQPSEQISSTVSSVERSSIKGLPGFGQVAKDGRDDVALVVGDEGDG